MHPRVLVALLAFVGASSPAFGDSKALAECFEHANANTFKLLACQSQEFQRQDQRLNVAYRQLQKRLPPAKAEALRNVQRAWLRYVESKCEFLWDTDEFTGQEDRLAASNCSMSERRVRADELELLAKRYP